MRNKQHYMNLLESNPNSSVGFTLAASAVYSSRFGICESEHHASDDWRSIARDLKDLYGENLSVDQVRAEMG